MGGISHLKLNIDRRPIANKYREGKVKRTLKREWKVLEIVNRETLKAFIQFFWFIFEYNMKSLKDLTFVRLFTLRIEVFKVHFERTGSTSILFDWKNFYGGSLLCLHRIWNILDINRKGLPRQTCASRQCYQPYVYNIVVTSKKCQLYYLYMSWEVHKQVHECW